MLLLGDLTAVSNTGQNHGIVPQDSPFAKEREPTLIFSTIQSFPSYSFSPSMKSCPFRVGSEIFHKEVIDALKIDS
jgi:hypothetical protein